MSYILNEISFPEILNSYVPTDNLLFDTRFFKLTTVGVRLRDDTTYGYLHIPIRATKFKGIKGVDCLYQGNLYYSVQTILGEFKRFNSTDLSWEHSPTEVWYDMADFYKVTSYNFPNGIIIGLKFDSTTLLNSVNVLIEVDVDDYWYYIHSKFDSYIKGLRFRGRLVCNDISTEPLDRLYGIPIELVTPVGGYNNVDIYSVVNSDGTDIYFDKNETHIIVNEELVGQDITVYFTYTCNTKISQGLDYVEIEKNPTLVVDNFTVIPSIEDSYWLPLYYMNTDGDRKGLKCQTQRGIALDFNLIISSTLYYDSLTIWETLFSHNFVDVGLPEIGNHFLVEITNPTRETIPYNTEGGRVLYSRVKLIFPYPVTVQEEVIVKSPKILGAEYSESLREIDPDGDGDGDGFIVGDGRIGDLLDKEV